MKDYPATDSSLTMLSRFLFISLLTLATTDTLEAQETTVIIVRHAERAAEPKGDPVLTAAGEARAEALLEAVRGAGVTHVLVTTLQRTALTAAPTAHALGLVPAAVNVRSQRHVAEVVDSIRARAGGVVLVVGHSNTVPAIVSALGGEAPEICDEEYDNLYVVTLPSAGGQARVIRGRFGVATPVDPGCGEK
jgi:broad specificity phosphatase PhoE